MRSLMVGWRCGGRGRSQDGRDHRYRSCRWPSFNGQAVLTGHRRARDRSASSSSPFFDPSSSCWTLHDASSVVLSRRSHFFIAPRLVSFSCLVLVRCSGTGSLARLHMLASSASPRLLVVLFSWPRCSLASPPLRCAALRSHPTPPLLTCCMCLYQPNRLSHPLRLPPSPPPFPLLPLTPNHPTIDLDAFSPLLPVVFYPHYIYPSLLFVIRFITLFPRFSKSVYRTSVSPVFS